MIICSGFPTGILRTERQYENFILEMEWRHLEEGGNAGLFLHTDALPITGRPFPRTVEAQILDGNPGDLFVMMGSTMVPDPGTERPDREGSSRPAENRINPLGEWNHYRVESTDGRVTLAINGKVVAGGTEFNPRTGYICLESEGAEAHFRNIRIQELPSSNPPASEQGTKDEGFVSLYTGVDFSGWNTGENEAWIVDNYQFHNDPSKGRAELWYTGDLPGDYTLFFDWQIVDEDAGSDIASFYLRGPDGPVIKAGVGEGPNAVEAPVLLSGGVPAGEWHRTTVTVENNVVTVKLDNEIVLDSTEVSDMPETGRIGFSIEGPMVRLTNVFLKRN
jgi:hypothetical protein